MRNTPLGLVSMVGAATLATGLAAQEFGTDADGEYAALLWQVMQESRLTGDGALYGHPYEGIDPHGALLETFYTEATVGGHTGTLVVKRNYGPAEVTVDDVIGDPAGHLAAVTVMFRREEGYDPDNQNWFWVKYLPDGTLDQNPAGMKLAGRVAKGADQGCIACHSAQDDYVFTTDADLAMMK
ncbi:MAG: cytochrome P460 family protein [Alphaproteobacteria bacterium]|nr:cytochrome P460 family protein [Alphaproteobacteria bacterium]